MKKRVFVFGLFLAGILISSMFLLLAVSVDAGPSGHACYDGTGFRVYQKELPGCFNIDCSKCKTATGSPCTGTPAPTYYDCKTREWACNLLNIAEIKPEDFECKTSGKYAEVYMGKSSMTTLVPVEKIKGYYITYPDACIQGARFFERWDTNFKKCVELVDGKEIYHGFLIGTGCSADTDIVSVSDTEFGQTAIKSQRCSGWCPPPHIFTCSPPGSPVTELGCQKDGEVCYAGWNDVNKNGDSEETKGKCYSGKCLKICPEGTSIEGKPCKVCDGISGEKNAPNGINCVAPGNLDGFCQNGECVAACPLPTITGAVTGTVILPPCKKCDEKGNIVADPSQNGKDCSFPDGKIGFCKNGECVERNCKNVMGADFQQCPAGSIGAENCCKKTQQCCHKEKDAPPTCCESEPEQECDTIGIIAKIFGKKGNLCKKNKCTDPNYPEKCKAGGFVTCCAKEEICSKQTIGLIWPLIGDIPTCTKKECDINEGEHSCGNPKKGKLCCKNNEKCLSEKGLYWCSPLSCPPGQSLCQGKGEAIGKYNVCCGPGTTCFNSPNGLPRCVSIQPTPTKMDKNQKSNIGTFKTSSASFYLLRNPQDFEIDGTAYHLIVNNDTYFKFNKDINLTFNLSNLDINNIELYKYDESLFSCTASKNEDLLLEVTNNENTLQIPGLIITIPSGAVNENTQIKIEILNLTCSNKQKTDDYCFISNSLFFPESIEISHVQNTLDTWSRGEIGLEESMKIIKLYTS